MRRPGRALCWAVLGAVVVLGCGRDDGATKPASPPPSPPTKSAEPPPLFAAGDTAAVRAAYAKAAERELDERGCVEWVESFPKIVVVGVFAMDRGCKWDGVFVGTQWFDTYATAASAGLAAAGWEDADGERRKKLARAWVDDVMRLFRSPLLEAEPEGFASVAGQEFTAPTAEVRKNGLVVVTGWALREQSGGRPGKRYGQFDYGFHDTGALMVEVRARGIPRHEPRRTPPTKE